MTAAKKSAKSGSNLDYLLNQATEVAAKVAFQAPQSYFQYDLVDAAPGTPLLITSEVINRKADSADGVLVNVPEHVSKLLDVLFPGVPKSKAMVMLADWAGPELLRRGKALRVTRR